MQAPYPPRSATSPQRSGAQRLRLLLRRQGVDKRIDFAVQHVVELVERQVDAMVGDAGLREVVSANSFRTVARADHRTAGLGDLRVLLRVGSLEQPRPQNLERTRLVLVLGLLIPADDHHPARDMRNPHGGVRRVDALTAGPRRTHYVDAQVFFLVDIDLDLVSLGQDRDGHRRSMNTARRFGGRYALHAMDAALELEPAVRAASAHQRDDSSPPVPARISSRTFLSSLGSRGVRSCLRRSSTAACRLCRSGSSSLAISRNSASSPSSSALCSATSPSRRRYSRIATATCSSWARSLANWAYSRLFATIAGSLRRRSSSA